jgi:hypothetical protein
MSYLPESIRHIVKSALKSASSARSPKALRIIAAGLLLTAAASGFMIWRTAVGAAGTEGRTPAKTNAPSAREPRTTDDQGIWTEVARESVAARAEKLPDEFRTYSLNKGALTTLLADAPHELTTALKDSRKVVALPFPDGSLQRFYVQEAPVLDASLQAEHPEIRTYRIVGVDDGKVSGRFDFTPMGLHATIISPDEMISVLPAEADGSSELYAAYSDKTRPHGHDDGVKCLLDDVQKDASGRTQAVSAAPVEFGSHLRTYKMAFSTTNEYSWEVGGYNSTMGTNKRSVVQSINGWLTGLNAIYERELSIRMVMVNDEDALFTNIQDNYDDRVPVANSAVDSEEYHANRLLNEVRRVLKREIGSHYHIGHLLTTNTSGGVAGLGAVCGSDERGDAETDAQAVNPAVLAPIVGPVKGKGYSIMDAPVGNQASLMLFAHEVGHQFGANHTFNGTLKDCASRNAPTDDGSHGYEVGSGNTIMSYNGLCAGDNIVGGQDARFHGHSFDQMASYITSKDNTLAETDAASCNTKEPSNNTPPSVSAGQNYTIPKFTPFTLYANGSDTDNGDKNNVTYTWEQFQAGMQFKQNGTDASFTDAGDLISAPTTRPIFRATRATLSPTRTFPSLEYILNNANDPVDTSGSRAGEELPRRGRTLDFRVTARDNAGGVRNSSMTVTVDGTAGPLTVNNTTGPWTGGSTPTVTWQVNGTNTSALAPFVRVLLSLDGGLSFPVTLLPRTANDGSEAVAVPNGISTSKARIKVEAVDNIFFDIDGTNFSIVPGGTCPVISDFSPKVAKAGDKVTITGFGFNNATVSFNGINAAIDSGRTDTTVTVTVPSNSNAGGLITMTEPSCADAQSTTFTFCTGTNLELKKDDGSMNSANSSLSGLNYHVIRLKPENNQYPATLSEVQIFHPYVDSWGAAAALPKTKDINIVSAANTRTGNDIDNLTFYSRTAKVSEYNQFVSYPIEPITITSGEFVVGLSFTQGAVGASDYYRYGVGNDGSANPNSSYSSPDGKKFTAIDNDYMIRAKIISGSACTPTTSGNCTSTIAVDDNTNEGIGQGPAGMNYYVNRLTPTSYPATLKSVRLYTPFSGYPSNTAFTILSGTNPSGGTNVNSLRLTQTPKPLPMANGWNTYDVPPITIYSGDFVIGYGVNKPGNFATISLDSTAPIQGRSSYATALATFNQNDVLTGTGNFVTDSNVNYPIRAVLFSNCANGGCTYSVSPAIEEFSDDEGETVININTQPGCPWHITRDRSWIRPSLNNGTGPGPVVFWVDKNPNSQRRLGSLVVSHSGMYVRGAGENRVEQQAGAELSESAVLTISQAGTEPDPTPSPVTTPTIAPSPTPGSISGTATYGTAPSGPARSVPGVSLTALGNTASNTGTNAAGAYLLTGFDSGEYVVTAEKTGDVNGSISGLDAARVAQHVAGLISLTPNQQLAGDATNNGSLSGLDAARIAQFAAGLANPGIAGQWKFSPASRTYPSVNGPLANQNYEAILVGDVTGNWTPSAAPRPNRAEEPTGDKPKGTLLPTADYEMLTESLERTPAELNLPETAKATAGQQLIIPVNIGKTAGAGVLSYEFTVYFDPGKIRPAGDPVSAAGALSAGWTVVHNAHVPGQLKVVAFGTAALAGDGALLNLRFDAVADFAEGAEIKLADIRLNEQDLTLRTSEADLGVVGAASGHDMKSLWWNGGSRTNLAWLLPDRFSR